MSRSRGFCLLRIVFLSALIRSTSGFRSTVSQAKRGSLCSSVLAASEHGTKRVSAIAASMAASVMAISVLLELLFGKVAGDGSSDGS